MRKSVKYNLAALGMVLGVIGIALSAHGMANGPTVRGGIILAVSMLICAGCSGYARQILSEVDSDNSDGQLGLSAEELAP